MRECLQKDDMRPSAPLVSLTVAILSAGAFWVDGSSLGELVTGPAILGLAVFAQVRNIHDGRIQAAIASVYLSSLALGAVSGHLIGKAIGEAPSDNLFHGSAVISGVLFAWAVCMAFLRTKELSHS